MSPSPVRVRLRESGDKAQGVALAVVRAGSGGAVVLSNRVSFLGLLLLVRVCWPRWCRIHLLFLLFLFSSRPSPSRCVCCMLLGAS